MPTAPEVLVFHFKDAGGVPNNPRLPALVIKHAAPAGRETANLATWFETEWPKHGWRAAWRWGVYDFPHYHSTAHEVLGVYRGHATLRLGDAVGVTIVAETGDVLILPAGTAHQNLGASSIFTSWADTPKASPLICCAARKANGPRPTNASRVFHCQPRIRCRARSDRW